MNLTYVQFKKYAESFSFFQTFKKKKLKIIHLQDMINNNFDLNVFFSLIRLTKEYFQHLFCIYDFIRSDAIIGVSESIVNIPLADSL